MRVEHETNSSANRAASRALLEALGRHWPEYLVEAAALGAFMVAACLATALVEHPASPLHGVFPSPLARRAVTGAAMGLTAVAIVYSPWGKRSGAHINPAVTLAFLRLGKIDARDAVLYAVAQFAGAYAGVLLAAAILGPAIADAAVNYAVTMPGRAGLAAAFAAECAISFALMLTVLAVSGSRRLASSTGIFAGALVALFITFEAPLSGMSMNPARSVASALAAGAGAGQWIYVVAPPLGMLLAAETYRAAFGASRVACAKLHHEHRFRCIFCGRPAAPRPATLAD